MASMIEAARTAAVMVALILAAILAGCSGSGHHDEAGEISGGGEHGRESGVEGEESGVVLALDQTYDRTRGGARLVLAYDREKNAFRGTVRNTTERTLRRVRVEVHLSNGTELGPTNPTDLAPGQQIPVELAAPSAGFAGWRAHPEVGSGEHGHGEHGGEHDREGSREHR